MKKAMIFILVIGAILVTGCGVEEQSEVQTISLPDGREVLCVYASDSRKAGVSCDWESIVPNE